MKTLTYILLTMTIALEAISEAMYDDNIKAWSKVVQIGMIGAFFGLIYLRKWSWHIPTIYILLRLLFFGMIYNIVRGIPYNDVGTTDFYDIYIAKYVMIDFVWIGILFLLLIMSLKYFE